MGYMDMITYKATSWYDGRTQCSHIGCRSFARLEIRRCDDSDPMGLDVMRTCFTHIASYFIPARAGKMDASNHELLRIE